MFAIAAARSSTLVLVARSDAVSVELSSPEGLSASARASAAYLGATALSFAFVASNDSTESLFVFASSWGIGDELRRDLYNETMRRRILKGTLRQR